MRPDLIVVANSHVARLLRRDTPSDPLIQVAAMEQPDAHLKPSEAGSDRPGHGSNDSRPGGVAFEPRMDPQRKSDMKFAHAIASRLEETMGSGAPRVLIFASNPFLGELKSTLSEGVARQVAGTFHLDLTAYGLDELETRIAGQLAAEHPAHRP